MSGQEVVKMRHGYGISLSKNGGPPQGEEGGEWLAWLRRVEREAGSGSIENLIN